MGPAGLRPAGPLDAAGPLWVPLFSERRNTLTLRGALADLLRRPVIVMPACERCDNLRAARQPARSMGGGTRTAAERGRDCETRRQRSVDVWSNQAYMI